MSCVVCPNATKIVVKNPNLNQKTADDNKMLNGKQQRVIKNEVAFSNKTYDGL
jgi:hypothetical protein